MENLENIISRAPVNMIGERYLRRHFTVYLARGGAPHLVVMTDPKGKLLAYRLVQNYELYFLIEHLLDHGCIFDGYKEYKNRKECSENGIKHWHICK